VTWGIKMNDFIQKKIKMNDEKKRERRKEKKEKGEI
jgi:hypothetical protein